MTHVEPYRCLTLADRTRLLAVACRAGAELFRSRPDAERAVAFRDLADLERLVVLRTERDVAWVRSQIVSMLKEDERVTAWGRIVGATRSAAP